MRRLKEKERRALKSLLYTDIRQDRREDNVYKCPYCGSTMTIKNGSVINNKFANNKYMICNNYPSCDSYCRVDLFDGRFQLVSTPANRELRLLRKEAHYWIDKLVETGICENLTAAFYVISQKTSITNGRRIHIGQCREFVCREIITACVEVLYANRNSINHIDIWKNSNVGNTYTIRLMKELGSNVLCH